MPGSRGNDPDGARARDLVEWQRRTFPSLRPKPTPLLDAFPNGLPADPSADPEETRRLLDELDSGE